MGRRIAVIGEGMEGTKLEDALRRAGCQTLCCAADVGAYALLRDWAPDAIAVAGCGAPSKASGWPLLDLLRLDPALRRVPIVVCPTPTANLYRTIPYLHTRNCTVAPPPFDSAVMITALWSLTAADPTPDEPEHGSGLVYDRLAIEHQEPRQTPEQVGMDRLIPAT